MRISSVEFFVEGTIYWMETGWKDLILPPSRPLPHGILTKLPLDGRHFEPNNPPDLEILLMIAKEPLPMPNGLLHGTPSESNVPFALNLPLARAQRLQILLLVNRHEHLLDTSQVMRQIVLETPCHKRTRGIPPRKEIVAAAGAVHHAVCGYVEDRAVHGQVDREGGICAVIQGELGRC